jgi:hypothetical protein
MQPRKMITPAKYARMRNLHRSTINRQIAAGLIPVHDGKVNPIEADTARRQNLDPARRAGATKRKANAATVKPIVVEDAPECAAQESVESPLSKDRLALEKEKLVQQIEELRLRNEREKGRLVLADEVFAAQFQRASAEKESWLNWPGRVAAGIAAQLCISEHELYTCLDQAVRAHLTERSSQPETS